MIRSLRAVLPKSRFGRATAVLVSGTVLSQTIVLLASPLLTRLYTPEDFGILGVFVALLGILGLTVCLRYELALVLAEDDRVMVNLLALAVVVALLTSAAVGLVVWVWGGPITAWVNAEPLRPWLWLLPIGLFALGCYTALNHWAIRREAFGRITRTRMSQSLAQLTVQIGFGWLALGPVGLIVGQVLGQSAGVTTFAGAIYRNERHLLRAIRPRVMIQQALRFRRMPTYGAGAALLNGSARLLPALLVAAIYGAQVAGWFVLAQRVLGTPMKLLGTAVGQVYLSQASQLASTDRAGMYALFMTTTWRLLAVGVLSLGVVVAAGPQLFALVFGVAWSETGRLAQFLVLMYLGQLVVSPTSQTLAIFERQDLQLAWDALRFALLLMVFGAAYQLNWLPLQTIGVLSVAMGGCYAILFAVTRLVLRARLASET